MRLFCSTVAQKVAVRQKRQVATVYAYFYAAAVLQKCYSSATFILKEALLLYAGVHAAVALYLLFMVALTVVL